MLLFLRGGGGGVRSTVWVGEMLPNYTIAKIRPHQLVPVLMMVSRDYPQ